MLVWLIGLHIYWAATYIYVEKVLPILLPSGFWKPGLWGGSTMNHVVDFIFVGIIQLLCNPDTLVSLGILSWRFWNYLYFY